ncbi:MAG: hypothetical protein KF795_01805 [Labilithrix sp.]|nr:hypothetical protein [Labilithrix sp.]
MKDNAAELVRRMGGHKAVDDEYDFTDLLRGVADEVAVLDPQGFAPEVRAEFATIKALISRRAGVTVAPTGRERRFLTRAFIRLPAILDQYGFGTGIQRQFPWMRAGKLREIVERDYHELTFMLIPNRAWKSVVILSGSILEGILVELLINDPARLQAAERSPRVPTDKGTKKPHEKWVLFNLVEIATDIGLVSAARANTFDQVLRDYRNFVHPRKEVKEKHECGEPEAFMAKGALDALCREFDRNPP